MKAGDIVYDFDLLPDTREALEEFLCDAIQAALGAEATGRLSNGQVADTLFYFLDVAVQTDKQKADLELFLQEYAADCCDE